MNHIPFPHILHGGDNNPEQWPSDVRDEDVRLMKLAHVNVATLPVFGWVSLQPDEDTWTSCGQVVGVPASAQQGVMPFPYPRQEPSR